jgi:23S rRNA-/tRNA-specific pseudouridylate synthase
LIWAKSYEALQYINSIIRERSIDKYYLTFVVWKFPKHLVIDKPIRKSYDKKFDRSSVTIDYRDWLEAKTECRWDRSFVHPTLGQVSLVKVKIYTWRMHQIRIHLANEWYPVLWDIVYGNIAANKILYTSLKINRQMLHCWKYSFFDAIQKKQMTFESPLPADFSKLLSFKK